MIKKAFITFAILIFAVQAAACNGKGDAPNAGASSSAAEVQADASKDYSGSGQSSTNDASADSQGDDGTDTLQPVVPVTVSPSEQAAGDSSKPSAGNSSKPAAGNSSDPASPTGTVSSSDTAEADGADTSSGTTDANGADSSGSADTTGETSAEAPLLKDIFQPLCQYPELPNGCEITSLASVLQYYGLPADKCDLSDNYLPKGPVGTVSFYEAFEGNPREEDAFGCYAPVIVNTANQYFSANGYSFSATELTGSALEDLFPYIDANTPVLVWATQDCREGHYSVTWNVNGEDLTWFTPEHCLVLVGYDDTFIWVADPMYGDIRGYVRELFAQRYESLYRQAIVIQPV